MSGRKISFLGSKTSESDNSIKPVSDNTSSQSSHSKPKSIKGGEDVQIVPHSTRSRKTSPSQNTIMGKSATQEMLDYLKKNEKEYQKKYNATTFKLLRILANNFSIEWLHCLAFSLAPENIDPQVPNNLASGPSWINSYMMVLEKVELDLAKSYPGAVSVKPLFEVLDGSDIAEYLDYQVIIRTKGKKITAKNRIKVLSLPHQSNVPSYSDATFIKTFIKNELSDPTVPSTTQTVFSPPQPRTKRKRA